MLNNNQEVIQKGDITYTPIYYILAIELYKGEDMIIPL